MCICLSIGSLDSVFCLVFMSHDRLGSMARLHLYVLVDIKRFLLHVESTEESDRRFTERIRDIDLCSILGS